MNLPELPPGYEWDIYIGSVQLFGGPYVSLSLKRKYWFWPFRDTVQSCLIDIQQGWTEEDIENATEKEAEWLVGYMEHLNRKFKIVDGKVKEQS
jgi:hypothetical protein